MNKIYNEFSLFAPLDRGAEWIQDIKRMVGRLQTVSRIGKWALYAGEFIMMRTSWQVAIAAEAFATAQLARCGWNVSIQYGGNPRDNDLIAVDGDRIIKVSVKGSNDGSWDLTQNQLLHADYHDVIDTWLKRLTKNTVLFFVQFKDVALDELPRMYLATPFEVGAWLDSAARGRGDTILYEKHEWSSRASAAGTVDEIPASWAFTPARLDELAKLNE